MATKAKQKNELAPPGEVNDIAAMFVPAEGHKIVGMDLDKQAVRVTMLEGIPTILVGHTGEAKTRLIQRMHAEVGWPYRAVPGHSSVEVETLVGKWIVKDGGMEYALGILPFCMKHGIAVGIQEINYVAPEVLVMLHEYLDEGYITLAELPTDHEDFVIRPHENFRLYGTMNPPELYPGARELSPALLRRCIVRQVEPLQRAQQVEVVTEQTGIDAQTADLMAGIAESVRFQFNSGQGMHWVSTADLVVWARLTKHMTPYQAGEIAVVGKAPSSEVDYVRGLVRVAFDKEEPIDDTDADIEF